MIKVKADCKKTPPVAETALVGRTYDMIFEFAMIVKAISNGILTKQDHPDSIKALLKRIAADTIDGVILSDISEVHYHAADD